MLESGLRHRLPLLEGRESGTPGIQLPRCPVKENRMNHIRKNYYVERYISILTVDGRTKEDFDKKVKTILDSPEELVFLEKDIPNVAYIKVRVKIININRKYYVKEKKWRVKLKKFLQNLVNRL